MPDFRRAAPPGRRAAGVGRARAERTLAGAGGRRWAERLVRYRVDEYYYASRTTGVQLTDQDYVSALGRLAGGL